ncbi:hypothetical protein CARUB_v10027351mg [Capsella rubella]|uniref:Uncharacterized protein n=1 Tax=Capsella rubella TaxID=81985 RepID=R0GC16_9BRAS|nr:uncharacterized protein LOC17875890 [Capsella rubella]EOA14199.1 hypothetical protein CARUB_v10027351mg [Capsella rubella]
MSLNCLTCQALPRTDSNKDLNLSGPGPPTVEMNNHVLGKTCCVDPPIGGRNWSGSLSPRNHEKIGRSGSSLAQKMKKVKKIPHVRLSGPVGSNPSNGPTRPEQPRLVRSTGVRRNWSFENLRDQGLIEEKRMINI